MRAYKIKIKNRWNADDFYFIVVARSADKAMEIATKEAAKRVSKHSINTTIPKLMSYMSIFTVEDIGEALLGL